MKNLEKKLKTIQANSFVMFNKLHNLHWNVKGVDFKPVHEMTETMYNEISVLFDDCAEKLLQKGIKPLITIEDIIKNAKIQEIKKSDFNSAEVFKIILADFETFLNDFKDLSNMAEKSGDKAIISFADGMVEKFEKDIWMVKQSLM